MIVTTYVIALTMLSLASSTVSSRRSERKFSKDFIFGASTSAYQIEGAWNEDGAGESIWDHYTHQCPSPFRYNETGDVAADSYYKYQRDVQMIRELGLDSYRFSISWSRILPTGFTDHINHAGVTYYNNLIDELLRHNIQPMVTIYHWDLPQALQDLGGFMNSQITEWYEEYARVCFEAFGDRVKMWITFNEPRFICLEGYGTGAVAPGVNASGVGEYICAKNLVVANARAYHLYDAEFRAHQGGQLGLASSIQWIGPLTDSYDDEEAAELSRQFIQLLYTEPIYSEHGGFPKELSQRVAQKSAAQGYPRSRLPEFTDEERLYVRGTADFFAANIYTTFLVHANRHESQHPVPSTLNDLDVRVLQRTDWPIASVNIFKLDPNSVYNVFHYLNKRYKNQAFYITESGWPTLAPGDLDDEDRAAYIRASLESVLDTLDAGVDLRGYFVWSLMDNFDFAEGYTSRFGLYQVDFTRPDRTRTPRKSAFVYKEVIRSRRIDHGYQPGHRIMTIDPGH